MGEGGRGQKPTWQPSDLAYLEQCLAEEGRTYNSQQLAAKLAEERQVTLSPVRIRKLLKKELSLETHPAQSPPAARPCR